MYAFGIGFVKQINVEWESMWMKIKQDLCIKSIVS